MGTDPLLADGDGDGIEDGADPAPRTGVRYVHADHLGSAVVLTKADGSELERVTYLPFGKTVEGGHTPESASRASASPTAWASTTSGPVVRPHPGAVPAAGPDRAGALHPAEPEPLLLCAEQPSQLSWLLRRIEKVDALVLVEVVHEFGEVAEARIALVAEHPHEALGLLAELLGELLKTNRGVDVVAEMGEADGAILGIGGVGHREAARQEAAAKRRVALSGLIDRLSEIAGEGNGYSPFLLRRL